MTKTYEIHRFAELFPPVNDNSVGFKALVEDIKVSGQQEPIWLYEGKILDGRNRYRACQLLGRDVLVREYTGSDPIGFVLSVNLHRRHLDDSQRAMVGAALTNIERGINQHTKGEGTSIEVASKLLNISRASIERARKVLTKGDVSLVEAVQQGNVTVAAAANIAERPTEQQKEIVKGGKAAVKKATSTNVSDRVDKLIERLLKALEELKNEENARAAAANIVQRLQVARYLERGKKVA